jgi:AbrB family looped-hinge helix DNA binding protein
MVESTISSRGRTTVPARVRKALNAKPGTRLHWHVTPADDMLVRAKTLSIRELAGSLIASKSVDIDDMGPWRS